VTQIPHNMRSYMCVPGGGEEGYTQGYTDITGKQSEAADTRCDTHIRQCCEGPTEVYPEVSRVLGFGIKGYGLRVKG